MRWLDADEHHWHTADRAAAPSNAVSRKVGEQLRVRHDAFLTAAIFSECRIVERQSGRLIAANSGCEV